MLEIELKAHIENRAETENRLNSFAKFISHVRRDDVYYKKNSDASDSACNENASRNVKIRLRTETDFTNNKKKYILTYKQKELRQDADGKSFEVNDEKECELSNPEPLEAFLYDAGFSVDLEKTKDVFDWRWENVLCELCEVPPLGWFLELEILADEGESKENVDGFHLKLEEVLEKAGVQKEKIENRYYSEMLKEGKNV